MTFIHYLWLEVPRWITPRPDGGTSHNLLQKPFFTSYGKTETSVENNLYLIFGGGGKIFISILRTVKYNFHNIFIYIRMVGFIMDIFNNMYLTILLLTAVQYVLGIIYGRFFFHRALYAVPKFVVQ